MVWILAAGVLVIALAIAAWRRTGSWLGKRLRVEGGNIYYTEAVTADEAERVARYLAKRGLFKAGLVDARLMREGRTYQVQLIASPGHPDEKQDLACEVLAAGLADDVLGEAPVEVHVCDRIFRPTSIVPHRGRFGRRIAMNAASLFYMDGVEDSDAHSVALFLAHAGLFNDSPKTAQINRAGEGYEFRVAVEVDPLTPDMVEGQRQMAGDLSRLVLGGKPVDVQYCQGLKGALRIQEPGVIEQGRRTSSGGPYRTEVFTVPREMPGGNGPRDASV